MRPVQTLYYDHGEMHCPVHGRTYIRFMPDDVEQYAFRWCCAAILPDGGHCPHSAGWRCLSDIQDAEIEAIAVEHQRGRSSQILT